MHYLLSSFLVAFIWSFTILVESHICITHFTSAFFMKLLLYGVASLLFYSLNQQKVNSEIYDLWKNKRDLLYLFIFSFGFLATTSSYFYYYSHNKSKKRSHIVIPITLILPSILAIIGTALFLKEKIKAISIVGMIFIVLGSYILVVNNK